MMRMIVHRIKLPADSLRDINEYIDSLKKNGMATKERAKGALLAVGYAHRDEVMKMLVKEANGDS